MKHVKTLTTSTLKTSMAKGGCGECQTSCQSACKTSCTVGNQTCENEKRYFFVSPEKIGHIYRKQTRRCLEAYTCLLRVRSNLKEQF